jgi:hypothetical protein
MMDAYDLQTELDSLIQRRNTLYGRGFVWGIVLLGSLPLPRLMVRIAPMMFFVALGIISSALTISGLLLLARVIGVHRDIREVKAALKQAKAKNREDAPTNNLTARYEIGADGELVDVKLEENTQTLKK